MKYCYWTSNCSKGISNIENYKCCNDCKKKDCEVRCKDCYDNCKYAATQQEIEQYVGKWTKPYIKPVVKATKPTVEKAVEIPIKNYTISLVRSMLIIRILLKP